MTRVAGIIPEIKITLDSNKSILERIQKYLNSAPVSLDLRTKKSYKPLVIATPNPEQIVLATNDSSFAKILNRSDIAIPDGTGVVWALGQSGVDASVSPTVARLPGVEFMEDLVSLAAKQHVRIGLIGGKADLAVNAFECLKERYPGLDGTAEAGSRFGVRTTPSGESALVLSSGETGSVDLTIAQYASRIRKERLQMVFVGFGAPKQEYFIDMLAKELVGNQFPVVLMSVGGSFDIISGRTPRAPEYMRRMGFEWLWRLMREPWRIKRQLSLLTFIRLVAQHKVLLKNK
jgi:N-acetylglucosaminyldiphosphoundecaprenol N-acetyl-beta-D-mannosaminyltransferase